MGFRLMERALRREFRRIVWLDRQLPRLPDGPIVLYANHHAFYDGYVLGYLVERVLRRRAIMWVETLERFPFFRALGALPFPADDRWERVATMRRTARAWQTDPGMVLIYFPEGRLHPWEEGVAWPADDRLARLGSLTDDLAWWPVSLRVGGWQDHRPTAYLRAGRWHDRSTGLEQAQLAALMHSLEDPAAYPQHTILEGSRGPHERWDFSGLDAIFSRIS
ncbi:MAG: 1-acyl-sn-glycerol-3-phosphate acyltransferase [Planctomycetota bacterium]|jgi:hypothetical protein